MPINLKVLILAINVWPFAGIIMSFALSPYAPPTVTPRYCPKDLCQNSTAETNISKSVRCKCDSDCKYYGDCCADAPTAKELSFSPLPDPGQCTSIPNSPYPIIIKRSCKFPKKFKKKCQASLNYTEQVENPVFKLPVVSSLTGISYGNFYCAKCQNETSYKFWTLNLECETVNDTIVIDKDDSKLTDFLINRKDLADKLKFNASRKVWQIVNTRSEVEDCILKPGFPVKPKLGLSFRKCELNKQNETIKSICPNNDQTKRTECPGFLAVVKDRNGKMYRNAKCALCNGVPANDIVCLGESNQAPNILTTSERDGSLESVSQPARENEDSSRKRRSYMHIKLGTDCSSSLQSMNFTRVIAETLYYESFNRTFVRNKTEIRGSDIQVCDMTTLGDQIELLGLENESPYSWLFAHIVFTSSSIISGSLALVHVCQYALSITSESLYKKTLSRFAIACFVYNLGLFSNELLMLNVFHSRLFCYINYILEYYGYLAAFFWCVSMAFEMTCTVWDVQSGSLIDEKRSEGRNWDRVTVYSWLSWIGPGVMTAIKLRVQLHEIEFMGCSFLYEDDLFHSFEIPVFVCLFMNLAFYIVILHVVCTCANVVENLSKKERIDFKLYTIFAVVTSFQWLCLISADEEIFQIPGWLTNSFLDCMVATVIYSHTPIHNQLNVFRKFKIYVMKLFTRSIFVRKDD